MATKIPQAHVSGLFDGVERLRKFYEEYTGKKDVWRIPLPDGFILDLNRNAYTVAIEAPFGGGEYPLPPHALVISEKDLGIFMALTAEDVESKVPDLERAIKFAQYVSREVWKAVHERESTVAGNPPVPDSSIDGENSHSA